MKSHETFAMIFAIVILAVWVLAIIGGIIRRDWTALNIVTPVLLTVAGWLYLRRNGNGKEK